MKSICYLRKEKGITQQKLATEIGVAKSTICQYEKGARTPDNETLIKIADFFGVSVDWLLRFDEKNKIHERYNRLQDLERETIENATTETEKTLLSLFNSLPEEDKPELLRIIRSEINKMNFCKLIDVIAQLNSEEVSELSKFIDYIISKRQ